MRIVPLAVGMIETNTYIVWDEDSKDAMIIDPGAYDKRIEKVIQDNELIVKYIFITHGHWDHFGGVLDYKEMFPDAEIVAGALEADILADAMKNQSINALGKNISIKADISLKDGDTFNVGNINFKVIETPGHSPGGISIYTSSLDSEIPSEDFSGTVFVGDTLFKNSYGRTDLYGGDTRTLFSSIKNKLFTLPDDTLVFCGHMGFTTIGNEKVSFAFFG